MSSPLAAWISRRRSFLVVQGAIVIASVCVTSVVAVRVQEGQIRQVTVERVTAVAQSLAELPAVGQAIEADDPESTLGPLAALAQDASGVDYVVITDDKGIRFTHPDPHLVGQPVSTDATAVLGGKAFIGVEEGTLGPTLRSKIPVRVDGAVVGTVSVGLLESRGAADLSEGVVQLAPWVIGSLLFGLLAAAAIDRAVTLRVRRFEAGMRELEVQSRLARVLRDQSHEFLNRMQVIYGLVEGNNTQSALGYIDRVARGVRRAGGESVSADAVTDQAPDAPLAAVIAPRAARLEEHGGQLWMVADKAAENNRQLDDVHLRVIANLVDNAIDAVLAAETSGPLVELEISAGSTVVKIIVADNGPGVSPQISERMFRRGATTKTAERLNGIEIPRGIGLALVRELVGEVGGVIEVGVSRHGGARFVVRMPERARPQ